MNQNTEKVIFILVVLFSSLYLYQIYQQTYSYIETFNNKDNQNEEKVKFQKYSSNDQNGATNLEMKNSNNIMFIIEQLKSKKDQSKFIIDLSNNVTKLDGQVKKLVNSQNSYAQNNTANSPANVSGTG